MNQKNQIRNAKTELFFPEIRKKIKAATVVIWVWNVNLRLIMKYTNEQTDTDYARLVSVPIFEQSEVVSYFIQANV